MNTPFHLTESNIESSGTPVHPTIDNSINGKKFGFSVCLIYYFAGNRVYYAILFKIIPAS